ncbi:MAG: nitroreductase family protein, partial [Treponema sp.]|nr:nitroreductase family protein [Treponema sp.]
MEFLLCKTPTQSACAVTHIQFLTAGKIARSILYEEPAYWDNCVIFLANLCFEERRLKLTSLDILLQKRRSIGKYTEEITSMDKIEEIINAGIWAPTACNLQGYHIRRRGRVEPARSFPVPVRLYVPLDAPLHQPCPIRRLL